MILEIALWILCSIGVIATTLGVIGILRFPDVYTRLHASTKCTTLGNIMIGSAVIIYGLHEAIYVDKGYLSLATHSFLAVIFILVTNPVSSHAIARAAHRSGVMPKFARVDKLKLETEGKNGSD